MQATVTFKTPAPAANKRGNGKSTGKTGIETAGENNATEIVSAIESPKTPTVTIKLGNTPLGGGTQGRQPLKKTIAEFLAFAPFAFLRNCNIPTEGATLAFTPEQMMQRFQSGEISAEDFRNPQKWAQRLPGEVKTGEQWEKENPDAVIGLHKGDLKDAMSAFIDIFWDENQPKKEEKKEESEGEKEPSTETPATNA